MLWGVNINKYSQKGNLFLSRLKIVLWLLIVAKLSWHRKIPTWKLWFHCCVVFSSFDGTYGLELLLTRAYITW